jgi:hypothetical protein
MPYADDPDGLACNDDLAIGKVGEFGKGTTRLGKPLQPA